MAFNSFCHSSWGGATNLRKDFAAILLVGIRTHCTIVFEL